MMHELILFRLESNEDTPTTSPCPIMTQISACFQHQPNINNTPSSPNVYNLFISIYHYLVCILYCNSLSYISNSKGTQFEIFNKV